MKKICQMMGLLLASVFFLYGCGNVAQNTVDSQNEDSQPIILGALNAKQTIIATSNLTLEWRPQTVGVKTAALVDIELDTDVTSIESTVPYFMTFAATSDVKFPANARGTVVAAGGITLNVVDNKLLAANLQRLRVSACMKEGPGLIGQTNRNKLIPLSVQVVGIGGYQTLSTSDVILTYWARPFSSVINTKLRLRLRGSFNNLTNQVYKGTLVLKFISEAS